MDNSITAGEKFLKYYTPLCGVVLMQRTFT